MNGSSSARRLFSVSLLIASLLNTQIPTLAAPPYKPARAGTPAVVHSHLASEAHVAATARTLAERDDPMPTLSASVGDVIGPCLQHRWMLFLPLITRDADGSATPFSVWVPTCRMLVQGFSGSMAVGISLPAGSGPAGLTLQGAPTGLEVTFNPSSLSASGTVTLTLNVGASVAPGTYPLAVQAQAGSQTATKAFEIQVVEPLDIQGSLAFDTGGGVDGAHVVVRTEDGQAEAETTSAGGGAYSVKLPALRVPTKVLVSVAFSQPDLPTVNNARWQPVEIRGAVQIGIIRLPNPVGAQLTLANGTGQTSNGVLEVSGLPGNVTQVFGRNYDPDYHREVFPGDFTENGNVPLNSAGFLWMEALDASGNPIDIFAQGVTVRSRLPRAQWADLLDVTPETGRIEVPIYSYDEVVQAWTQDASLGWLEDAQGQVIPENRQSVILDGSLAGDVFAVFTTTQTSGAGMYGPQSATALDQPPPSYKNIDYPHIGPWNLSDMDPDKRDNDCTKNALDIANTILHSQKGRDAYSKVNKPDADFDEEFAPGKGPKVNNVTSEELKKFPQNRSGVMTAGAYVGDNYSEHKDKVMVNNALWEGCGPNATDDQKTIATFWIADTVLHEAAHWKDDNYKYGFWDWGDDTPGEEGSQLEKDLFGGVFNYDNSGQPTMNGKPVDIGTIRQWLDPSNWPPPPPPQPNGQAAYASGWQGDEASPLQITLVLTKTTFAMGENIPVQVTFTNISNAPIRVLKETVLESWPLHFDLIHQATGNRARFLGPEVKLNLQDGSFVTLPPNGSLAQTYYLLRDPDTGVRHYRPFDAGSYSLRTIYNPAWEEVPQTESNQLTLTVLPGGSLSGLVTNADTGQPIDGAIVLARQDGYEMAKVNSMAGGSYSLSLPPGSYMLEAHAHGYASDGWQNVVVTTGQTTTFGLSLLPLDTNYAIIVGQVISDGVPAPGAGRIEVAGSKDYYVFQADPGQRVFFDIQYTGPVWPLPWRLVDDDGTEVFDACLGCSDTGAYTLSRGGIYALTVGDENSSQVGIYRFQLWDVPPPSHFVISIGDVISNGVPGPGAGVIENPGATDIYTFNASPGQQVFFDKQAAAPDIDYVAWHLEDANGTVVFDRCLGCGDIGVKTLTLGGTYTLTVGNDRDDGVGSYRLQLWNVPPPSTFNIAIGDVISNGVPGPGAGMVESPGATDIYTFNASPGQAVFFDRQSSDPGVTLVGWSLVDTNGTEIFNSYLGGLDPGTKVLTLGGAYTMAVGSDNVDGFGAYRFQLWNVPPPSQFAIAIGDVISPGVPGPGAGVIESPGAMDIYTFNASAGQKISFDLQAVAPSAYSLTRRLVDANGVEVFKTCLGCVSGTYTLTLGSAYTLTIGDERNAGVGTYQFRILAQP